MNLLQRRLLQFAAVGVAFGAWAGMTSGFHLVDPSRFPGPGDVGHAFGQLSRPPGYAGGTLLAHAASSVAIVLGAFVAASLVGVPLGVMMGVNRRIQAFVQPVFLVMRPIPPIAWIPLAVLWFGIGAPSKI
ncbi:MAG: ABC transporter permease, partial [Candidatus Eremiobacteraeota bacterium]|nr:ABC transporter permease [Candidatus Eremiobacteraeota bacterium]